MNLKDDWISWCVGYFFFGKTTTAQKKLSLHYKSLMFALSSSRIASSSSTRRRTSKSSRRRRRNEGKKVCFVSSKSSGKSGLEIDSAEKTKKSSFSSSIQNTFSSSSASLVKACSLSTSFFLFQTENAFAASADAEELKQFLIGFWNFRTGDVTSILLYTVAPIALPYLIFSQVICSYDVYLSLRRSRYMFISLLFSSRNKSRKNRLKS